MLLRSFLPLGSCVLLLSACASLKGRDPLVSDRPDFTESTQSIAPRHVQLEAGQTLSREGETKSNAIGEVLVRAGLTPRVELRLTGNSFVREKTAGVVTSGMQDAAVGFKIKVLEGPDGPSWKPAFSFIAHTTVPSGAAAFSAGRAQPEVKLLGAWTITDRLGFASNINIGRPFDGTRSFTEYAGSGSFSFAVSERVGAYTEAFAFAPQDGSDVVQKYVNGGFTLLLSPDVQLDLRGGLGPKTAGSRDYFAGIGLVLHR